MADKNKVVEYKKEVKVYLKDQEAFNSLARHTFSGLEAENIPQALLLGLMKGFSIEDFMVGDVYAIPFNNNRTQTQEFTLVTSIDHMRKTAMKSGQSGKSAPMFGRDEFGNVENCSISVYKSKGDSRGYTATVFKDEYDTGKNLWVSKPKTMLAKVAEMHALRMAFPEQLSEMYVKEELEHDTASKKAVVTVSADDTKEIKKVIAKIKTFKKLETLQKYYLKLTKKIKLLEEVIKVYNEQKAKLQDKGNEPKK